MDADRLRQILAPYNPWWVAGAQWKKDLPTYERPIVREILSDLADLPQAISVTGPRRVGKSTAVKQVVGRLIKEQGIDPQRILYYSFDDPEVFASEENQRKIFDSLAENRPVKDKTCYFFLDEIQRLPRWELFIKKYYDLKRPIRFVVSGSASSPIFRSSQETLLGRIKDRHLLPFSFREYCEYRFHQGEISVCGSHDFDPPDTMDLFLGIRNDRLRQALLDGDGETAQRVVMALDERLKPCYGAVTRIVIEYCLEGGFPEVWALHDPVRKIEYLMEQQIRKVLYEDLMMLTPYRKPENVLRFFLYLLAHPGMEINASRIAKEAGVERRVIEDNLPKLELTDLIMRIRKFSHQPLRVREGNMKCYPVDMALRNAVLKTWDWPDQAMMGLYAENLVMRELASWPERIELTYFREKDKEVDFIVTHGGNRYLPIEVKSNADDRELAGLRLFMKKFDIDFGVVVTRERSISFEHRVLKLPLRHFLLAV